MRLNSRRSLLRYFTMADEDLPPSYVKSCRAFLDSIRSRKPQAPSTKLQAPSATKQTQLNDIKNYES